MRHLIALTTALLVGAALVSTATAAPDNNPKATHIPVDCGDLGSFEVLTLENESVVAWAPNNNSPFVAKRFSGTFSGTVTTNDGNTFTIPPDSFDDSHGKGTGYQDRLNTCTFTDTFTDHFPLDEHTAADWGIPSQYIGTEVTLNATFNGTVGVISTGN